MLTELTFLVWVQWLKVSYTVNYRLFVAWIIYHNVWPSVNDIIYYIWYYSNTHSHNNKTGNNFQRQIDWNNHLFLPNTGNLIAKKNKAKRKWCYETLAFICGPVTKQDIRSLQNGQFPQESIFFYYQLLLLERKGAKWNLLLIDISPTSGKVTLWQVRNELTLLGFFNDREV